MTQNSNVSRDKKTQSGTQSSNLKKPARPAPFAAFGLLLSLLALFAVAGLGWFGYQQLEQTKVQLADIGQQQTKQSQTLEASLASQRAALGDITTKLGHTSKDWVLGECAHLVRMAQDSLTYTGNFNGAIQGLESAQQRVQLSKDPALKPIRQALTDKILALRSMAIPDVNGLMAMLNSLDAQVAQLPLRGLALTPEPAASKVQAQTAASMDWASQWRAGFKTSLNEIRRLVVIRRHDKPVEPLMVPQERAFLNQNLQLQLELMGWAATTRNQALYSGSQAKAQAWVNRYFESSSPAVKAFQEALTKLSTVQVAPELPVLGNLCEESSRP